MSDTTLNAILKAFFAALIATVPCTGQDEPSSGPRRAKSSRVADPERTAILRMLSSSIESEIDKVKTWSGTYSLQDLSRLERTQAITLLGEEAVAGASLPPPYLIRKQGAVTFAVEPDAKALFSEIDITQFAITSLPSTDDVAFPKLPQIKYHERAVLTPEHYLHYEPGLPYGEFIDGPTKPLGKEPVKLTGPFPRHGPAGFRDQPEKGFGLQSSTLVDPVQFLGDGMLFHKELAMMADMLDAVPGLLAKDPNLAKQVNDAIQIKEFSDLEGPSMYVASVLLMANKDGSGPVIRKELTCKRQHRWHVVRYTVARGESSQASMPIVREVNNDFEEKDGVLTPAAVVRTDMTPDGRNIAFQRIFSLTASSINKTLPAETFTVKGLGIRDGERFIDRIDGRAYVIRGGQAHMVEGISVSASSLKSKRWFWSAHVIVIAGIAVVFVARRVIARRSA